MTNDLSGTPQGAGGVVGLLMIQERDLRRRHLAIQTTPPAVYAPCTDLNGNILSYIEINRGEGLTHSFEYDAFGKELAADTLVPTGNGTTKESLPFRFSTKYHDDETDLAYYGYRFYNPELGRWLNRDPIAEQGGVNLYGMVGNDAVNRRDYLGLDPNINLAGFHNDNGASVLYETGPADPYPHCINEGWFRHCYYSCVLQHHTHFNFVTQFFAQRAGQDRPGNPERDENDINANQKGIELANANFPRISCKVLCLNAFDEAVEKKCCHHDLTVTKTNCKCSNAK